MLNNIQLRKTYIQKIEQEGYQNFFPDINDFASETDNICFGCSKFNDNGLKMEFFILPDQDYVISPIVIDQKFCGYPIFAHGGVLTTLIDEIMSHTINFHLNKFAVTRSIQMDFLKPVYINKPILIIGKVINCIEKPKKLIIETRGEIREGFDLEGPLLTTGKGIWIEIPKEQLINLKSS